MTFAFIFESVGGTEWLVLLGVVLIVVGPRNLPAAARKLGKFMTTLRRAADEFKRQVMSMDQEFTKGVNEAVADDSSSTSSGSTDVGTADSGTENGEDLYGEDNPYPGYEEYYDETQYSDGSDVADASDGGSAAEGSSASPDGADSAGGTAESVAKHVPTDEELRTVKITVTTDASAKKGSTT